MDHNKVTKQKLRTLCTIDTSDIQLNDLRNNHTRNNLKKNQRITNDNRTHSRAKSRATPMSNTPVYMKASESPVGKNKRSMSKKLNKTMNKSRVLTDYGSIHDQPIKNLTRKVNNRELSGTHRSLSCLKKKVVYHYDDQYRTDAYELLMNIATGNKKQKMSLVKREGVLYLVCKTKDNEMKKKYFLEEIMKDKMINMKGKNLMKVYKSYSEKPYRYLVYEYAGQNLSWEKPIHKQVIHKCLKDQGAVLVYFIREIARAISELSSKGYVHGRICLENTYMKISQTPNSVKVEGNVKLANFSQCFLIHHKKSFLSLPNSIYTPPQIINYKIFDKKGNFDRKLIECISIEDQPWYIDVWSLGIMSLELIAGEPINLQKVVNSPKKMQIDSLDSSFSQSARKQDIWLVDDDITLIDILLAQKNLLFQTQEQFQAISFNPKLQSLLVRMLSVSPLDRPSPKQIIKQLGNSN